MGIILFFFGCAKKGKNWLVKVQEKTGTLGSIGLSAQEVLGQMQLGCAANRKRQKIHVAD